MLKQQGWQPITKLKNQTQVLCGIIKQSGFYYIIHKGTPPPQKKSGSKPLIHGFYLGLVRVMTA